jgi:hypothetical protein
MKTRKNLIVFFCLLILITSACMSREKANEVMIANQEKAVDIIEAIENYERDHGQLPEKLDVLVPAYLPEIPETMRGQSFDYVLHNIDGYYLCFDVTRRENLGCCYYYRIERWDCSYGDGN